MKQTLRGNEYYYDSEGVPRFCDTNLPTAETYKDKPCGICNKYYTPEGHDPCIGTLLNVMNACCGHGNVNEAYVQFSLLKDIRGQEALNYMSPKRQINEKIIVEM